MAQYIFVMGDGDRVRDHLDALLFAGQLDELKTFSEAVSEAVVALANGAISRMGGEIVVAGGDDLLLRIPADSFDQAVLQSLRESFHRATGCSLSVGTASDIDRAYLNLRRAKARGGDSLIQS